MQATILIEQGHEHLESLDVEGLALFVMQKMNLPSSTDVTITFTSDERIQDLNRTYRNIDKPTDVLSFECDNVPFEGEDIPANVEYELGDIVIATDVASRQTVEYGTTFEEEITLLVVHGLLHLCGYDHQDDAEAEVMEALEKKLISAWEKVGARQQVSKAPLKQEQSMSIPKNCGDRASL